MSTLTQPFTDRKEAGLLLAARLQQLKNHPKTLVLALAREGMEVGAIPSILLNLPTKVFPIQLFFWVLAQCFYSKEDLMFLQPEQLKTNQSMKSNKGRSTNYE